MTETERLFDNLIPRIKDRSTAHLTLERETVMDILINLEKLEQKGTWFSKLNALRNHIYVLEIDKELERRKTML